MREDDACNGDFSPITVQVMPIQYIPAAMIAATILISTTSAMGRGTPQSSCLSYEPGVVTLSGTLVRKTFPGPPNYESVKKGDRPETNWFLGLPESAEQYQRHKGMVGRKVLATGTLFGEHTGHHRTPVLLTVRTLDEAPK